MADEKILDMPELTAPADGDMAPIVDVSDSNDNKKISYATLRAQILAGITGDIIYWTGSAWEALDCDGTDDEVQLAAAIAASEYVVLKKSVYYVDSNPLTIGNNCTVDGLVMDNGDGNGCVIDTDQTITITTGNLINCRVKKGASLGAGTAVIVDAKAAGGIGGKYDFLKNLSVADTALDCTAGSIGLDIVCDADGGH